MIWGTSEYKKTALGRFAEGCFFGLSYSEVI